MLQFYFLSIFFNLLTGFVLLNSQKNIIELPVLNERVFRIILGAVTAITGIIKLFVVINSRAVIVADFLPAVAGMAGGFTLFIQNEDINMAPWLKNIFVANKLIVGIACMAVALLHFVFPGALFL